MTTEFFNIDGKVYTRDDWGRVYGYDDGCYYGNYDSVDDAQRNSLAIETQRELYHPPPDPEPEPVIEDSGSSISDSYSYYDANLYDDDILLTNIDFESSLYLMQ